MKYFAAAALALMPAVALADGHASTQGDIAAGEEAFARNCVSCHVVENEAGDTLAGRNSRTGPNLYAVGGRQIASVEDFNYGDSIVEIGADGTVWTEEAFVAYVQDPTGWLRETLDNRRARGKMAFQLRDEQSAYDIYAYLESLASE